VKDTDAGQSSQQAKMEFSSIFEKIEKRD